jgi:hypothetical protein
MGDRRGHSGAVPTLESMAATRQPDLDSFALEVCAHH